MPGHRQAKAHIAPFADKPVHPLALAAHDDISPRTSRAAHQIPARFTSAIADGMPDTVATARSSLAPELAFTAAGDRGALRCSGMMAPSAPATSALRRMAPRFCGSMIPSNATSNVGFVARSSFKVHTRLGLSSAATPWCTPAAMASSLSGDTSSIGASLASSSRRGSWPSPEAWKTFSTLPARAASRTALRPWIKAAAAGAGR